MAIGGSLRSKAVELAGCQTWEWILVVLNAWRGTGESLEESRPNHEIG
jgi:hypothetical protein